MKKYDLSTGLAIGKRLKVIKLAYKLNAQSFPTVKPSNERTMQKTMGFISNGSAMNDAHDWRESEIFLTA